jgi:two-component system alkaline phosphatase synthesis response regulator PhoP
MDGHQHQPSATVLVVDDEPILRETIKFNLERDGFTVLLAGDGETALTVARDHAPELIVLDIMLPVLDGLQVLRILREESTVPILLLSARGEEIDRVLGLELGADDYLTKPFAMRELVARVRAMIRRSRMPADEAPREAPAADAARSVITAGHLSIDPSARQARIGGKVIELKPKEFDLLLYLARHPGVVLSRDALLREVWGYAYPVDTRTVDVHIRGIRQKIEPDASQPTLIETVRGYGYRFADSVSRV